MNPSQLSNFKQRIMANNETRERVLNSVFIKDLPITDIRWNLEFTNEVREMDLARWTVPIIRGYIKVEDVLSRVTFTIFMSYSEANLLCTLPHPLHNIIMKKRNYLEGPKPGTLKRISDPSLPSYDWDQYGIHLSTDETLKNSNTVKMLKWLWSNHRRNYDAWMKMIMAMGTARRLLRVGPNDNYSIDKCVSTNISVNALIGPRGLCHGFWNLEVPKLRINPDADSCDWPSGWSLHLDTDDSSSFHISSPENSDFDTDSVDSGPAGVAGDRPRITGLTSFTETSSESTATDTQRRTKPSRLDAFVDGHSGNYWDRRTRKRFDLYVKSSANERRYRRAVREARRLVRIQYNVNHRKLVPAFDSEAKRAEALAAQRVRAEMARRQEDAKREKINNKPRRRSLKYYLNRYRQLNYSLRSQLECEWRRYYGENLVSQVIRQPVNQNSKHIENHNDLSLKCWVSPVMWIDQQGINSGGFSALYMAMRQFRLIEVILGDEQGKESAGARDVLRRFPKGARYIDCQEWYFEYFNVNSSSEWNELMVSSLITRIINYEMTNWGEIFSAQVLAAVANTFISERFTVSLVRRDLLANRFIVGPQRDRVTNVKAGDLPKKQDHLWTMSVVQHLVRGHFIVVCYDADEKMRPTYNDGRTAHWTLLCGVIVGFPAEEQQSPAEREDARPNVPNSGKVKYSYMYKTDTHLLTPMGQYICTETGEPLTDEKIRERAKLQEAEELKNRGGSGGYKHSKECHVGRHKCQKCAIEYVDTEMDLERDADSVWVVARERDAYQVWSLRELAHSNRQLRKAGRDVLNTVPRSVKYHWTMEEIEGRGGESAARSPRLKAAVSAFKQRKTEERNAKNRENRAVCAALTDQMMSLSRAHPRLSPSKLIEMLDLSVCVGGMEDVWKSAAKVAFEAPVRLPRTEPTGPARSARSARRLGVPMLQAPEAPPPPPIPISPTPVSPPMHAASTSCPYVFPEGWRLDQCLARQYICIGLKEPSYQNESMDFVPDTNHLNDALAKYVQYYFTFEGKWRGKKESQPGWTAARNASLKIRKAPEQGGPVASRGPGRRSGDGFGRVLQRGEPAVRPNSARVLPPPPPPPPSP